MKNTILPIILPFVLSVAPLAAQQNQPSPPQAMLHQPGVHSVATFGFHFTAAGLERSRIRR